MEEDDEDDAKLDMDRVVGPAWSSAVFFIGGVTATTCPKRLQELHGIKHLVSLGIKPSQATQQHLHALPGTSAHWLLLEHILDVDAQDLLATVLPLVLPFLSEAAAAHHPTLVHCAAGQSRSVAAVLAYYMVCEGQGLVDAWRCVARSRQGLNVNPGFLRQLNWVEDHRQGVPTASAEYRLYLLDLLPQQSTVIPSHADATTKLEAGHQALWGLLDTYHYHPIQEDKEEWVGRCRHCQYPLFSTSDQVRHNEPSRMKEALARVAAISEVSPETAAFAEYERAFHQQPLLHLLPLPHQRGPKRKKGGGKEKEKEKEKTSCPYYYVCPPEWALPLLLASLKEGEGGGGGGGGMVCLRCPGRHCGAAVGSMQAFVGGAGALDVCDCGGNLPRVVVRFNRVDVAQPAREEEEEEEKEETRGGEL